MRIQDREMTKQEFISYIVNQKCEFTEHVDRLKTQYAQIRLLKQNLPQDHAVVHMDFKENYACRNVDEIQSAYFNQTCVTLYPVVVYYTGDEQLKHSSIVLISDTLAHNAASVAAFLDTVVFEVRRIVPYVKVIHYWTDSPTSQYRNKLIFDIVANHYSLYNCAAVWNYFEAGHGKGPCDGLSGTVKRMADTAIKTGKVMIQDADDFFAWANEKSTFVHVTFKFISEVTINEKVSQIADYSDKLRPIKGTMKLHAVKGKGNSTVVVRETSCYCQGCLSDNNCETWREEKKRKAVGLSQNTQEPLMKMSVNNYVAAVYEEKWYVGKILSIDNSDKTVEISFMERKINLYQWPRRSDKLWVTHP